jgi:hypothetical protein
MAASFSIGCPFDQTTSNPVAYCNTQHANGGDALYNCITTLSNNQACNLGIPAPISGAEVINSAITTGGALPPNANCWSPFIITGPMNGADPGDKLFVGGGRRLGDGQLRNGEYLNMYTAQGVSTAFHLAGMPVNTVISKGSDSNPVQGVNIVNSSTNVASGAVFNYLGANNGVPYTPVNSNAAGASLPVPGQVLTSTGIGFSNLPSSFTASKPAGPSALATTVAMNKQGPVQSVEIAGRSIYAMTAAAQPPSAAPAPASFVPSFGAFGRKFGTTY